MDGTLLRFLHNTIVNPTYPEELHRLKRLTAGLALVILGALPSSVASATPLHGVLHAPRHTVGSGTSTNWSGYDVTGSGATHVIGSWTQPTATCAAGESSWSSPWVGIDGDTSNTVEQTGTDSDCQNGSPVYYAWYEMYPKGTVQVPITVHPGDSFTGEVTYNSGSFVLKLTDNSTNSTFTTTQPLKRANLSSVEWIMEGPSKGSLTNFNSVSFTNPSATVNGTTGTLGSLSPLNSVTMVTSSGANRAVPSSVKNSSFSVTWQHS
jgi:hypothetical protein